MGIHKSLLGKGKFAGAKNVRKRGDRVLKLIDENKWTDDSNPFKLPKERIIIMKRKKKAEKEEKPVAAAPGATPGAAPAAPETKT